MSALTVRKVVCFGRGEEKGCQRVHGHQRGESQQNLLPPPPPASTLTLHSQQLTPHSGTHKKQQQKCSPLSTLNPAFTAAHPAQPVAAPPLEAQARVVEQDAAAVAERELAVAELLVLVIIVLLLYQKGGRKELAGI